MTIPNQLESLVMEIPNFVTSRFCSDIISRADDFGFYPATITTDIGTIVAEDIRKNDRVIFDDLDLAHTFWAKAVPEFGTLFKGHRAVGINERFRVYRYRAGQYFDWHQDGEYSAPSGRRSLFTMMIYLSDGCEGGGTSFADVFSPHVFDDFTISPKVGKALFFHHPLSHRGDEILSGEKYVLRSDVMFEDLS